MRPARIKVSAERIGLTIQGAPAREPAESSRAQPGNAFAKNLPLSASRIMLLAWKNSGRGGAGTHRRPVAKIFAWVTYELSSEDPGKSARTPKPIASAEPSARKATD